MLLLRFEFLVHIGGFLIFIFSKWILQIHMKGTGNKQAKSIFVEIVLTTQSGKIKANLFVNVHKKGKRRLGQEKTQNLNLVKREYTG